MAPLGTKVVAHIDAKARATWHLNGEVGWYVGLSIDHYRCVEDYLPCTRATRACNTVTFFPHSIPFLQVNLNHYLKQTAGAILQLLTVLPSKATASLQAGNPVRNALLDIAEQLQQTQPINDTPWSPTLQVKVLSPRVVKDSHFPTVQETDKATMLQPVLPLTQTQ